MLNKQGIDIEKIQHIKEDILNYKNYLNQYLCHFLDNLHTVLKEELGISKDVINISQNLSNIIRQDSRTKKPTIDSNNVKCIRSMFKYNLFDIEFNVIYRIYNFADYSEFQRLKDSYQLQSSFSFEKKRLILVGYGYGKIFNEEDFNDGIYHEIEHLYQTIKSEKSLNSNDSELYNLAIQSINSNNNEYMSILGYIIYLSRRFEQDAYSHGLYGLFRNSGLTTREDIENVLPSTQIYGAYVQLTRCLSYLVHNCTNRNLLNAVNEYGKNFKWFINTTKKAKQNIQRKISRTITKYLNDINSKH